MRIGEFAEKNNVTRKMLRHYDAIGLLKPADIDRSTGYRVYTDAQNKYMAWINVLKNLEFSLKEIQEILSGNLISSAFIHTLKAKRRQIGFEIDISTEKQLQLNALIRILEKEGFDLEKKIDLLSLSEWDVHELKKNMPNIEMFLDEAGEIAGMDGAYGQMVIIMLDIWHFKTVNDTCGFQVGDSVILAYYNILKEAAATAGKNAVCARLHGDAFIVCFEGDQPLAEAVAKEAVRRSEAYDFQAIGCSAETGCRLGGIVFSKNRTDLWALIEKAEDLVYEARKKGKNSYIIEHSG